MLTLLHDMIADYNKGGQKKKAYYKPEVSPLRSK